MNFNSFIKIQNPIKKCLKKFEIRNRNRYNVLSYIEDEDFLFWRASATATGALINIEIDTGGEQEVSSTKYVSKIPLKPCKRIIENDDNTENGPWYRMLTWSNIILIVASILGFVIVALLVIIVFMTRKINHLKQTKMFPLGPKEILKKEGGEDPTDLKNIYSGEKEEYYQNEDEDQVGLYNIYSNKEDYYEK